MNMLIIHVHVQYMTRQTNEKSTTYIILLSNVSFQVVDDGNFPTGIIHSKVEGGIKRPYHSIHNLTLKRVEPIY